jgi:hypothetical protein
MKQLVIVLAVLFTVGVAFAGKPSRVEKIPLVDTLKGKYTTVIVIDTMKITHHLKDTTLEVSADTVILKAKNVTIIQESKKEEPKEMPKEIKKEEPKVKKEELKKEEKPVK